TEGRLLSLISFFMFGAVAVPAAVAALDLRTVLYAIASLTAVRMVPVAIALAGRRYDPSTVLYIGWFGPRGIASIVFAFLAAEQLGDVDQVVTVVSVAVVASLLLHGLSAGPLSARYGNAALAMDAGRPERDDAGAARVWSSKDSAV
ncbi:MAG: cation:proton antiporter, partial [Acidimicrobiia bacterium]|nr:cation:proton antiporter [Acidimicrobiia bacterium]